MRAMAWPLLLLAGCVVLGDEDPYPPANGGGAGGFEAVGAVFQRHCNSCHSGRVPSADLDLKGGAGLFEPDGSERPSSTPACGGLPQVRPFEPDASCLWIVIREGLMPPVGKLPTADQAILYDWIAEGAVLPSLHEAEGAGRNGPGPGVGP